MNLPSVILNPPSTNVVSNSNFFGLVKSVAAIVYSLLSNLISSSFNFKLENVYPSSGIILILIFSPILPVGTITLPLSNSKVFVNTGIFFLPLKITESSTVTLTPSST